MYSDPEWYSLFMSLSINKPGIIQKMVYTNDHQTFYLHYKLY